MGCVFKVCHVFSEPTVQVHTRLYSQQDAHLGNGFYALVKCRETTETEITPTFSFPKPFNPPNKTCSNCVFDLFLYKKGTIYITFIKSFGIIKYNVTLLQKFEIPATIQDKLPIEVHTVSFFHHNIF